MGILDTAGDIGDILAQMEKGRARGRLDESNANANYARAGADIYGTTMDAALKGPRKSAQDAALGDTLANVQPFQWTGDTAMSGNLPIPQSRGGLGPQNFGPATRQAGATLAQVGASRVGSPKFDIPTAPILAQMPQSNTGDSILSTASLLASLAKAAGGGGGPKGGGNSAGGDIGKIAGDIKDWWNRRHPGGNTGQLIGDFTDNLDDPFLNGNTGQHTGDFPHNLDDPSLDPIPNVDTNYDFNNDPYLGGDRGGGNGGYYDDLTGQYIEGTTQGGNNQGGGNDFYDDGWF